MRLCITLVFMLMLVACNTTAPRLAGADQILNDQPFPLSTDIQLETPQEIFALPDELKHRLKQNVLPIDGLNARLDALVAELYQHNTLYLTYENAANTIASETYINQQANCLSMSILAFAMAEYVGLEAVFREVMIPELWVRREGYSMLNGHLNVRIKVPGHGADINLQAIGGKQVVVDFDPGIARHHFPTYNMSKSRVIAMFYNNKAADAILQGDLDKSYAYLKAALNTDPNFVPIYGNLGVTYRIAGALVDAKKTYDAGLNIAPNHTNLLENLAIYYAYVGDIEKANDIQASISHRRTRNPYYHFILGEEAYASGRIEDAIKHYRRALNLQSKVHEFHFGMAKALASAGDYRSSELELKRALKYVDNQRDENRYSSKLDLLAGIH